MNNVKLGKRDVFLSPSKRDDKTNVLGGHSSQTWSHIGKGPFHQAWESNNFKKVSPKELNN